MSARNGAESFGWVSQALHWAMAVGILFMLGFGFVLARMQPTFGNFWLYGLHKTLGITLLALILVRIIWHRISPPPEPLGTALWQSRAARAGHGTLYLLMLAVPLVGWIASSASGIDTVIFNHITLPRIAPVSQGVSHGFFLAHKLLTWLLELVLLLHVGAALHHHFVLRDRTLRRMIRG